MGERTGIITFLNIHDYIGIDGHPWSGCLASIETDGGEQTSLYATSDRLILALATFYATKSRATVDFSDAVLPVPKDSDLQKRSANAQTTFDAANGMFTLKAIWSSPI
ncbi:hypothetical protein IVB12_07890 [Bradyrhizobium sp. 179]|uniref:hypothetical protein n=1 Tax=Bradyrhizobium sp. 179 TaxID=2782648 RepID=UPI001FF73D07|nr:hypothetical protein [Bradyrhizobium sp. 179]MCK1541895.1 hypothetical protein [Bradyrhizobium sp. 179]